MTCALAPSNPSSKSLTTFPVTHGASPLLRPTKWALSGPCALPSPPLRPPPLPPPLPKVTAPMRINQTGLVPEPPPPYRPPKETRSLTWRDTTQMTPVSDDFPSCHLHRTCLTMVFSNMSTCVRLSLLVLPLPLPLSLITASPFLPPVAKHPSRRVALWLYLSPFLSISFSSSISTARPCVCACMHVVCYPLFVCLCAAANSFPLSRQTANCCCCKECSSPPPPSPLSPIPLLSSN